MNTRKMYDNIILRTKIAESIDFTVLSAVFFHEASGMSNRVSNPLAFHEASGIRTPDNLIKSQVLYRLS